MLQSERARETTSIADAPSSVLVLSSKLLVLPSSDAPTVSEFRVGQVTRSGLVSLSLQDRQGLSGHGLRLCLSSSVRRCVSGY